LEREEKRGYEPAKFQGKGTLLEADKEKKGPLKLNGPGGGGIRKPVFVQSRKKDTQKKKIATVRRKREGSKLLDSPRGRKQNEKQKKAQENSRAQKL